VSAEGDFVASARRTYAAANAASLRWLMARPPLGGKFLNTKQNSITLADYSAGDGWRGPSFLYGWIQGRGLEAIATQATFFSNEDAALAADLDVAGRRLYGALAELKARDGHAYFCYDAALQPVRPEGDAVAAQNRPADLYTYSDAFVCKGLAAAAARHFPADLPRHVDALLAVVAAIEDGRFVIDERKPLDRQTLLAQEDDFAPRMILLGAAALLARIGRRDAAGFADRFIAHILDRHYDGESRMLLNVPGEEHTNPGHAIEFVGFALEFLPPAAAADLIETLAAILSASFRAGMSTPGLSLTVSAKTGKPTSAYCPWWSLPETIRAAALLYERTGGGEALSIWRRAHEAFFSAYWRGEPPIAYQNMIAAGPVDVVPATPDLDPGYHTGLSLLAAIEAADRVFSR
jgi:hypothetical protein